MGLTGRLGEETKSSIEGVGSTVGKFYIGGAPKDLNITGTFTSGNATYHTVLGVMPKAGQLVDAFIVVGAVGIGSMNITKCVSGTAATSGTRVITNMLASSLTSNSINKCTLSSGYLNFDRGDRVVLSNLTGTLESLSYPYAQLKFNL